MMMSCGQNNKEKESHASCNILSVTHLDECWFEYAQSSMELALKITRRTKRYKVPAPPTNTEMLGQN